MQSQITSVFKVKEWEDNQPGWDVEVEHTYNKPLVNEENHSDYSFIMKGYWKTIKLIEKTTFDFLPNNMAYITSRVYELEVWDKETNKTTTYKCVKAD